ncbi:MAG: phosphotransferase [Burkholderiaceae bacterium]
MSTLTNPSTPSPQSNSNAVTWANPQREAAFRAWFAEIAAALELQATSLRLASADASFRRYLRIDGHAGSYIIMDAPPEKENCQPFVHVATLMEAAGLNVPRVLAWQQEQGFMLLSDLGHQTMMQVINPQQPTANQALYQQAVTALIQWQKASQPGVLPNYDAALLRRELELFPEWYLGQHRGIAVEGEIRATLNTLFNLIVARNLAWPSVYVHRDFMPRNLITPTLVAARTALPPEEAVPCLGRPGAAASLSSGNERLGVLDFQDAVYGPITYDIASLMRDAFLSWGEDFVLDITIRYWQQARAADLPVGEDFGAFYQGVEWMGLQRHLKVAGIFARLSLRDGKPHYLADTPRFIGYIRATASRYQELKPLLRLIDQVEGIESVSSYAFGRV